MKNMENDIIMYMLEEHTIALACILMGAGIGFVLESILKNGGK